MILECYESWAFVSISITGAVSWIGKYFMFQTWTALFTQRRDAVGLQPQQTDPSAGGGDSLYRSQPEPGADCPLKGSASAASSHCGQRRFLSDFLPEDPCR